MATIRNYQNKDLEAVTKIFNYYVENHTCTFQLKPFTLDEIRYKADAIQKIYPFLVLQENNEVIGFAYGSRWRAKEAYDLSVETTIYLKPGLNGHGLGSQLYSQLIESLKTKGFHLLIGGLTLPNPASIRLHEKLGFEKVGEFKDAGKKFGQWHCVGFWQKIIS
jgi:phosphinothricin acetyltransferase